ncbi:uncharacterized protein A1O5_00047 [Cladophialophora psammophila CBS 110553]|uniref:Heterokaryon incompatibility domain-containing protein n=1 Tax=Cladophialophora psammophila CBS 110553 TaxID=1182543 RepID=W9XF16_9EURO|nr:uncharacterized protein A1O5_00047 [Cladophialophora psammophila CBS 110553]EXJ75541.1 hypothetical protein A1O5_00047 [Cladophialophora psammophila CBS 110553]
MALPARVKQPNRSIEIPYLGSLDPNEEPYDKGEFASYIDRVQGWTMDNILNPTQSDHTLRDLAQMIQNWLFFGLVHQAFGQNARHLDFIDISSSSRPLVTLLRFRRLCHQEYLRPPATQAGSSVSKQDLEKSIALAAEIVGQIHLNSEELEEHLELILLSVMILCDALQLCIDPRTICIPSRRWPLSDVLLEKRMRSAGWCPSDVQRLTKMLDLHSLTLMTTLPPRDFGRHDSCDGIRCNANDIVPGHYRRAHHGCDDCQDLVADPTEIFDILEDEHLPLIDPDQGEIPKLKLKSTAEVQKYIAISHVWSDGLGNPQRNAIYSCQLSWLQTLASQFSQPGMPVWLDTISCPRDYEHMRERARKAYDQAIAFMRRTYAHAEIVVVLDHSLLEVETRHLTGLNILLRIASCGWTRRLWTYQEGVLAKKLFFQFADRAVDMDEVYSKWQESSNAIFYIGVRGAYKELRILLDSTEDDYVEKVLHRVSRPLQFRKTSVPSDEALCLAALANLRPELVKKVSESKKENRMETFYASLPVVCKQLVFWHGDRMKRMGYRWAPASFLNNSHLYLRDWDEGPTAESNTAMLSTSGLSFECPGILLGKLNASLQSVLVSTGPKVWYHVTCRQFGGETGLPFQIDPGDGIPDISLAILNPIPFHQDFALPGFGVRLSLLVAIVAQYSDSTYIAQTLCPVFVLRKLEIETEFPLVMKTCRFFKHCLQVSLAEGQTTEADIDAENAHLLDDETLIHQYKARGSAAVLEHTQAYELGSRENALWGGTCLSEERLCLVRSGIHNVFEGIEIGPSQKWCLD